jgi:hypothetical protein
MVAVTVAVARNPKRIERASAAETLKPLGGDKISLPSACDRSSTYEN